MNGDRAKDAADQPYNWHLEAATAKFCGEQAP
jgi:hypothetical protein